MRSLLCRFIVTNEVMCVMFLAGRELLEKLKGPAEPSTLTCVLTFVLRVYKLCHSVEKE